MLLNKPTTSAPVSVAIVEDKSGLRETLSALINSTPGFYCVGAFSTGEAALEKVSTLHPDVILMDIHFPDKCISGIECVRRLKESGSAARILMLTIRTESEDIFEALKAGASGYLSKSAQPAEIIAAIQQIHRGGAPMSGDIAVRVVQFFNLQGATKADKVSRLSARESEILERLAAGALYKEIAAGLGISYDTVHWHIRNIYQKLQVRSRSQAIAEYFKQRS